VVISVAVLASGSDPAGYYVARQAGCAADYYAGVGERAGAWLGAGAPATGLVGQLDDTGQQTLRALLDGRAPDGRVLVAPVPRADPRGRLPAAPLAEAIRAEATQRGLPVDAVLAEPADRAAFALIAARVDQPRGGRSPTVDAVHAGRLAEAAGLDPHDVYRGGDGTDRYAAALAHADRRVDVRRAGIDVTVSAPKSVSILYGLGPPAVAAAVREAHQVAVGEALGYLQAAAGHGLRGHQGDGQRATRIGTHGWIVAAFEHRTSRAAEPTLPKKRIIAGMTDKPPQQAILLCRISDARDRDDDTNGKGFTTQGVDDQEADERALAKRLGWGIGPRETHVIVENDTSAFKRRKIKLPDGRVELRTVRPKFRRALDMLARGEADGLVVPDLDRLARDSRDLEDLIDVVESRTTRIPVESVTGSLRLANDADVTMARVMVAVANKSSRDTARRVARARLRQATNGQYGGGRRPFGFEPDGVTVRPAEAAEIVKAADGILAGVTLRATVAGLNKRGAPTVSGRPWTSVALKGMLCSPRTAGLVVYRGDILEDATAPWPAILPRETWEALRHILTAEDRRTSPGNQPRWLGSGIYLCGHPQHIEADPPVTMRVGTAGTASNRIRAYRCRDSAHLVRAVAGIDDMVERVVVGRLAKPDAAALLTVTPEVDTATLSRQVNELRARITEAGGLWEDGVITGAELKVRRSRLTEKLANVEAQLRTASGRDPLVGLAGNPDAATVWEGLDLGRRRAVLDTLVTVTVLPAKRGRYFDPASVDIAWKRRSDG